MEMGDELIEMLNQIFKLYYQELREADIGYDLVKRHYKYLQMLLGFPIDAGIAI